MLYYPALDSFRFFMAFAQPAGHKAVFDFPWLRYLGRISYGIYMYQVFAIIFSIQLARTIPGLSDNPLGFHLVVSLESITLTFLFASTSWKWMESPILQLNKQWTLSRPLTPLSNLIRSH